MIEGFKKPRVRDSRVILPIGREKGGFKGPSYLFLQRVFDSTDSFLQNGL